MYCMLRVVGCNEGVCIVWYTVCVVCNLYVMYALFVLYGILHVLCGIQCVVHVGGRVLRDFFIIQCVHTVYRVQHVYTVCIVWYTVCSVCWGLWVV